LYFLNYGKECKGKRFLFRMVDSRGLSKSGSIWDISIITVYG